MYPRKKRSPWQSCTFNVHAMTELEKATAQLDRLNQRLKDLRFELQYYGRDRQAKESVAAHITRLKKQVRLICAVHPSLESNVEIEQPPY